MDESKALLRHTDEAIAYCDRENLVFWLPQNIFFKGWALCRQNIFEKGLSLMEQGLAGYEATNAKHTVPYFRALLAAMPGKLNEVEEIIKKILGTESTMAEKW